MHVTCVINQGLGGNLTFSLWAPLNGSQFEAVFPGTPSLPGSTINIVSYPPPVIDDKTLRFSYTAPFAGGSLLVAQSNYLAQPIAFVAHNILNRPDLLSVYYGDAADPRRFVCTLDPALTTLSTIACTSAEEPIGFTFSLDMSFTVDAAGQSARGHDIFRLPQPPHIVWVRGCKTNIGNATSDCNTEGGQTITICGSDFVGPSVLINSLPCSYVHVLNSTKAYPECNDLLTCVTPSSAGFDLAVVISANGEWLFVCSPK